MRFFIPIDRESVRVNPRAGETTMRVPGRPEAYFLLVCTPEGEDRLARHPGPDVTALLEKYNLQHDGTCPYEGSSGSQMEGVPSVKLLALEELDKGEVQAAAEKLRECVEGVLEMSFNLSVPTQVYRVPPGKPYFYDYVPTQVKCEECGREFMHTELISDSVDFNEGCAFTETKCPHCGEWDCCEVTKEALTSEMYPQEDGKR